MELGVNQQATLYNQPSWHGNFSLTNKAYLVESGSSSPDERVYHTQLVQKVTANQMNSTCQQDKETQLGLFAKQRPTHTVAPNTANTTSCRGLNKIILISFLPKTNKRPNTHDGMAPMVETMLRLAST